MWRKTEIENRIAGKPYLRPVYTHSLNIPERLRQNDPNLFVVRNLKTNKFEVHSLANKGSSFSLSVPYKELDARTETYVRKQDLRRHGILVFQEMERKNRELEKQNKRDRRNRAEGIAQEIHKPVRRLAWEVT